MTYPPGLTRPAWLTASELRIGLGCKRLSTDEERSLDAVAAAAQAGITVFDTAHAYGLDERDLGHDEALLSRALRRSGASKSARIVTKGGSPSRLRLERGRRRRGPRGLATTLLSGVAGPVETAFCPHGGGPPTCWCRPPLPGLPLAFARAHGVDLARSTLVRTSPAHRTLATVLAARYASG